MVRSSLGYHPGDRPIPGQDYELLKLLGVGQFGEVWKAEAPGGFEVALKLIDLTRQEGEREFAALRQLRQIRNPHLTPITASWILDEDGNLLNESSATEAAPPGGSAVFQSEGYGDRPLRRRQPARLIVGMGLGDKCLSKRLKECKAEGHSGIPLEELLEYMAGAAKGLDYLHRPIHEMGHGLAPIIHRDIKPHNILIVGGEAQVCDFGLARAMPNLVASRTKTAVGTLAYMAPEVAEYRHATERSDQYSFAITYFELRTGKLPFGTADEPNVVDVVRSHESGRLKKLNLLTPAERRVVAKAADKNPARRYTTCSEFVKALRYAVEEEPSRRGLLQRLFGPSGRRRMPRVDDGTEEFPDSPDEDEDDSERTRIADRTPKVDEPGPGSEQPAPSVPAPGGPPPAAATAAPAVKEPKSEPKEEAEKAGGKSERKDVTEPVSVVETLPHDSKPPRAPSGVEHRDASPEAPKGGTMVAPHRGRTTPAAPPSPAEPAEPVPPPDEPAEPSPSGEAAESSPEPGEPAEATPPPREPVPLPSRRHRGRRVLVGIGLLVAVLAGAAFAVKTVWENQPEWQVRVALTLRDWRSAADVLRTNTARIPTATQDDLWQGVYRVWFDDLLQRIEKKNYDQARGAVHHAPPEVVGFQERLHEVVDHLVKEEDEAARQAVQRAPPTIPEEEQERLLAVIPVKDPNGEIWRKRVLELVSQRMFSAAMQKVESPPPELAEEQQEWRGVIADRWRRYIGGLWPEPDAWDRKPVADVARECKQYIDWFPAAENPSSAQVKLLLADCRMHLMPRDWNDDVQEILDKLEQLERESPDFFNRASVTFKMRLIRGRFDLVRERSGVGAQTWIQDFKAFDGVKKDYIVNEASDDIVDARSDPYQVLTRRNGLVDYVVREAWKRLGGEGDLRNDTTKRTLDSVMEIVNGSVAEPTVLELKAALHVITLGHPDEAAESIEEAIDELHSYVTEQGTIDRVRTVVRALGSIADREAFGDDLLAQAVRLVQTARRTRSPREPDFALSLTKLWERRVRIWLARPSIPLEAELKHLSDDVRWLRSVNRPSPLLELAVAYYGGDDKAMVDGLPEELPERLLLFTEYMQLLALRNRLHPEWDTIVHNAATLLSHPEAQNVLKLHGRLATAVRIAIEACSEQQQAQLRKQAQLRRDVLALPKYPYFDNRTAEHHEKLLDRIAELPAETLGRDERRRMRSGLALALACREKPDWGRVWQQSKELAGAVDDEPLLVQDALHDACVRSYLELAQADQDDPSNTTIALESAVELLDRIAGAGGLPESKAVQLYSDLLSPLRKRLAGHLTDATDQGDRKVAIEPLERYHATLGDFIELHRFAPFTGEAADHEKANAKLREILFTDAIRLHDRREKANRDSKKLAEYYVERGHARAELEQPNLEGARKDVDSALENVPKDAVDTVKLMAYALRCHVLLVQSRQQTSVQPVLGDLNEAIEAGLAAAQTAAFMTGQAIEPLPEDAAAAIKELASKKDMQGNVAKIRRVCARLLLHLSYTHLEQALFTRDPTRDKHRNGFRAALQFAKTARDVPDQRYPEHPWLAMGNAYEDLAWIVEDEPEENYRKAIEAFRQADRASPQKVLPLFSEVRSLYMALYDTGLLPGLLPGNYNTEADVRKAMTKLLNDCVERAGQSDTDAEVQLYLGRLAALEKRFKQADEHFRKAWDIARDRTMRSEALFACEWAQFPLRNGELKKPEQIRQARERAKTVGNMRPAQGGMPNPAKEAVWVRAITAVMEGDNAKALDKLDKAIPDPIGRAELGDLELLLLRSEIRMTLAVAEEPANWRDARSALADVNRAVEVAVTRFELADASEQAFLRHVQMRNAVTDEDVQHRWTDAAEKHLEKWYDLGRHSEALGNACYGMAVWKEQAKQREEALTWIERAIELAGSADAKKHREDVKKRLKTRITD